MNDDKVVSDDSWDCAKKKKRQVVVTTSRFVSNTFIHGSSLPLSLVVLKFDA